MVRTFPTAAKGGRDIPWEFESAGIREYRYPNISPVIGGGVATIAGVGRSGETSKASQLPARLRRFFNRSPDGGCSEDS